MSFTVDIPGGAVQLSGNPILVEAETTTTGMTNHRLLCEVTCTDGAIPGGPWIDSIQPLDGEAIFDIHGLVDGVFDYIFNRARMWSNRFNERDALSATITVDIGETYIDGAGDLQETWNEDPDTITVLKGKLSRHEFNVLNKNASSFFNHFVTGERWLTKLEDTARFPSDRRPAVNVALYTDPVKGWFIASATEDINIKSKTYYSDGTDYTYTDPAARSLTAGQLYEVDLERYAYYSGIPEDGNIIKYEVWAEGSSIDLETFTVYVSNVNFENHNFLFFANSLGAVEVLNCYGESDEKIVTEGDDVTQENLDFDEIDHTVIRTNGSYKTRYKINTGYKTLPERRWIKDLLITAKAWMWQEDPLITDYVEYNVVPVVVVPGSFEINDTSEDLMSIEFEVEIAHEY